MMPFEIKQLKNALQKEEQLQNIQSQLLIQDCSNIKGGDSVELDSPRCNKVSMMENPKFSMSLNPSELPLTKKVKIFSLFNFIE